MPITSPYLLSVAMDVAPEKAALFHDVYEREHIPLLLKVPGVLSATRFETQPLTMVIGGARQTIVLRDQPQYTALYELATPDVLVSDAWVGAVDQGRWPTEVRPFTTNRRHALLRRL